MGNSTTTQKVVINKSLRDLLKEEQEPFLLNVYLLEKGYRRKTSNEKGNLSVSNKHFLKASFRLVLNKSRKSVSQHTKRIKDVFNKLISNSVSKISKIKNHDEKNNHEKVSGREIYRSYGHEANESNPDEKWTSRQKDMKNPTFTMVACNPRNQEQGCTDRNLEWTWLDESKQHSPVSVLEDIPSSLCKLFLNSATKDKHTKELQSRYAKSKGFLQHTKQILFDFVREAVEIQARRGRDVLGSEELGKIICGKMKICSKQCGNESNLTNILESDFMDTTQERFELEEEKKGLAIYIGDTIFEDIKSEILIELTNK